MIDGASPSPCTALAPSRRPAARRRPVTRSSINRPTRSIRLYPKAVSTTTLIRQPLHTAAPTSSTTTLCQPQWSQQNLHTSLNPNHPPPNRQQAMKHSAEKDDDKGVEKEDDETEEAPKLDEGFYKIEDIWKKRVRKGQLQYFTKWWGWPETVNNW